MVRIWVGTGLATLGLIAAIMAAQGLPWSGVAGSGAPAITPPDDARRLTDAALRQLRPAAAPQAAPASPAAARPAASPDAMAALTQAVVRNLIRGSGGFALERAVQLANKHAVGDAYVAVLLAEAQRANPDDTATRLRVLSSEGSGDARPAWEPTSPSPRPPGNFQRP